MKEPQEKQYGQFTRPQFVAAVCASLGSLLLGFTVGFVGDAIDMVVTNFYGNMDQIMLVANFLNKFGVAGAIAGGLLLEYIGRKKTMLVTPILFFTSWILIICAPNFVTFLIGWGIGGLSTGVIAVAIPVYLGEVIQPKVRGVLGFVSAVFVNFGALICSVASLYTNGIVIAYLGGGISVAFFVLLLIIPESPRWYVSHRHTDRARNALVWLKGKNADVEPELDCIIRSQSDADMDASNNIFLELLKGSNLKPLLICIGLTFFQQFSGFNVIYQHSFIEASALSMNTKLRSIFLIMITFIGVIFGGILIDRLGRKILLYISNIVMITALFCLGGYFYAQQKGTDVSSLQWMELSSLVIYLIGFAIGLSQIPRLMMGEILPVKVRGPAAGITLAIYLAIAYALPVIHEKVGDKIEGYYLIWLYGSICIVGIFFVRFCVPETKGKTLEDIEYQMTGRKRRITSTVNINPKFLKA